MKTMYRVPRGAADIGRIREVSVIKETAHFVTVNNGFGEPRNQKKETDWSLMFATKEDAVQYVSDNAARFDHAKREKAVRGAAPELLEALEDVVGWMESPANDAFSDSRLAKAKAAIAKAKGE